MCFEWDERYFREHAERKRSEEAAKVGQESEKQPAKEQEELAS